jgi:hypothetical protein
MKARSLGRSVRLGIGHSCGFAGFAFLIALTVLGCATSRSNAPADATVLPRFEFSTLRGADLQLRVLDHRADPSETQAWAQRVTTDISGSLAEAGATLGRSGPTVLEVRIHHLRSDFENRQWKGCAKLAATLSRSAGKIEAVGERCVTKSNLLGGASADNAMKLAYQDALAELLSSLDSQLR